jgi:hypothetical protein
MMNVVVFHVAVMITNREVGTGVDSLVLLQIVQLIAQDINGLMKVKLVAGVLLKLLVIMVLMHHIIKNSFYVTLRLVVNLMMG